MSDKVGDADHAFDIHWARYDNAERAASYTVKLTTLTTQTAVGGYLAQVGEYDGYEFQAWQTGTGTRALNHVYGASGHTRVRYARMTVRWQPAIDLVRGRLPRSRLPQVNGRLRVAAETAKRASKWSRIDAPERRLKQG